MFNSFYPPPWGYGMMQPPQGDDTLRIAKAIIKEHKAEKKKKAEEEKQKTDKSKPRTFTLLETWGILMLGSIPLTLAQIHLLQYAQEVLNNTFHVVPH